MTGEVGAEGSVFAATAVHTTRSYGTFQLFVTNPKRLDGEHLVLLRGPLEENVAPLVRVASCCVTSTALDSADCDCADQLAMALRAIDAAGAGVLVYLDQEGRGHGLTTKVLGLANKNQGFDTLTAVEMLGLPTDVREYGSVRSILDSLGISRIRLMTNNSEKLRLIKDAGIDVAEVVPVIANTHPRARPHVEAKLDRYRIDADEVGG